MPIPCPCLGYLKAALLGVLLVFPDWSVRLQHLLHWGLRGPRAHVLRALIIHRIQRQRWPSSRHLCVLRGFTSVQGRHSAKCYWE